MARPQVSVGGDGHQIWKVAADIMNKQCGKPTMGGPPAWGLGVWLTTIRRKKISLSRNVTKGFGLGRILWINDIS
jgi:hypothetical protein